MFANPSEAEMNTAQLDARSMTEDQWNNAVNAMPFLAAQRLVILGDPSARFAQRRQKPGTEGESSGEAGADALELVEDETGAVIQPDKTAVSASRARAKFLEFA